MTKEEIICEIMRVSAGQVADYWMFRKTYIFANSDEFANFQYAIIEYLLDELINSITKPMSRTILELLVDLHNEQTQVGGWRWDAPLHIDDLLTKENCV